MFKLLRTLTTASWLLAIALMDVALVCVAAWAAVRAAELLFSL